MSLTLMTTGDFVTYLKSLLPQYTQYFMNGAVNRNVDNSIGILKAPDTRSEPIINAGGLECTVTSTLPVNILIRWGNDTEAMDLVANEIYSTLLEAEPNIQVNTNIRIANCKLLDGCAVGFQRDIKNICEALIRVNIEYYLTEV